MPAAFAGDQIVDAGAEILQDEVLLGGRLAVVDFLRPLLERQLDSERLVDGERDVEEVEAVDAEIVDRVAFRRDLLARDIARLGDNIGHRVESRRHRVTSWKSAVFDGPTGGASSPEAGPLARKPHRGSYSERGT